MVNGRRQEEIGNNLYNPYATRNPLFLPDLTTPTSAVNPDSLLQYLPLLLPPPLHTKVTTIQHVEDASDTNISVCWQGEDDLSPISLTGTATLFQLRHRLETQQARLQLFSGWGTLQPMAFSFLRRGRPVPRSQERLLPCGTCFPVCNIGRSVSPGNNPRGAYSRVIRLRPSWRPGVLEAAVAQRYSLHDAVREGRSDQADALLGTAEGRARLNLQDAFGRTPLHEACGTGAVPLVALLLEARALAGVRDQWGQTCFHTMARTCRLGPRREAAARLNPQVGPLVARQVLEAFAKQADAAGLPVLLNIQDHRGRTALHVLLERALGRAGRGLRLEDLAPLVGAFLALGSSPEIADVWGRTPRSLMQAICPHGLADFLLGGPTMDTLARVFDRNPISPELVGSASFARWGAPPAADPEDPAAASSLLGGPAPLLHRIAAQPGCEALLGWIFLHVRHSAMPARACQSFAPPLTSCPRLSLGQFPGYFWEPPRDPLGRTPLHHAVGARNVSMCRALLDLYVTPPYSLRDAHSRTTTWPKLPPARLQQLQVRPSSRSWSLPRSRCVVTPGWSHGKLMASGLAGGLGGSWNQLSFDLFRLRLLGACDGAGRTALHLALYQRCLPVAETLLGEFFRAPPPAPALPGTPYFRPQEAANQQRLARHIHATDELKRAVLSLVDREGNTPVAVAVLNDTPGLLSLLLRGRASTREGLPSDAPTGAGVPPPWKGRPSAVEDRHNFSRSALAVGLACGRVKCVDMLLEVGAEVCGCGCRGRKVLWNGRLLLDVAVERMEQQLLPPRLVRALVETVGAVPLEVVGGICRRGQLASLVQLLGSRGISFRLGEGPQPDTELLPDVHFYQAARAGAAFLLDAMVLYNEAVAQRMTAAADPAPSSVLFPMRLLLASLGPSQSPAADTPARAAPPRVSGSPSPSLSPSPSPSGPSATPAGSPSPFHLGGGPPRGMAPSTFMRLSEPTTPYPTIPTPPVAGASSSTGGAGSSTSRPAGPEGAGEAPLGDMFRHLLELLEVREGRFIPVSSCASHASAAAPLIGPGPNVTSAELAYGTAEVAADIFGQLCLGPPVGSLGGDPGEAALQRTLLSDLFGSPAVAALAAGAPDTVFEAPRRAAAPDPGLPPGFVPTRPRPGAPAALGTALYWWEQSPRLLLYTKVLLIRLLGGDRGRRRVLLEGPLLFVATQFQRCWFRHRAVLARLAAEALRADVGAGGGRTCRLLRLFLRSVAAATPPEVGHGVVATPAEAQQAIWNDETFLMASCALMGRHYRLGAFLLDLVVPLSRREAPPPGALTSPSADLLQCVVAASRVLGELGDVTLARKYVVAARTYARYFGVALRLEDFAVPMLHRALAMGQLALVVDVLCFPYGPHHVPRELLLRPSALAREHAFRLLGMSEERRASCLPWGLSHSARFESPDRQRVLAESLGALCTECPLHEDGEPREGDGPAGSEWSPMTEACRRGRAEVVEMLLAKVEELEQAGYLQGLARRRCFADHQRSMLLACRLGHWPVCAALARFFRGRVTESPFVTEEHLIAACASGHPDLVESLLTEVRCPGHPAPEPSPHPVISRRSSHDHHNHRQPHADGTARVHLSGSPFHALCYFLVAACGSLSGTCMGLALQRGLVPDWGLTRPGRTCFDALMADAPLLPCSSSRYAPDPSPPSPPPPPPIPLLPGPSPLISTTPSWAWRRGNPRTQRRVDELIRVGLDLTARMGARAQEPSEGALLVRPSVGVYLLSGALGRCAARGYWVLVHALCNNAAPFREEERRLVCGDGAAQQRLGELLLEACRGGDLPTVRWVLALAAQAPDRLRVLEPAQPRPGILPSGPGVGPSRRPRRVVVPTPRTPLGWAARRGHGVIVEALLSAYGLDLKTTEGWREPLYFAIRGGQVALVEMLVRAGADLRPRLPIRGLFPLSLAAIGGSLDMLRLIIGALADQQDPNPRTPLLPVSAALRLQLLEATEWALRSRSAEAALFLLGVLHTHFAAQTPEGPWYVQMLCHACLAEDRAAAEYILERGASFGGLALLKAPCPALGSEHFLLTPARAAFLMGKLSFMRALLGIGAESAFAAYLPLFELGLIPPAPPPRAALAAVAPQTFPPTSFPQPDLPALPYAAYDAAGRGAPPRSTQPLQRPPWVPALSPAHLAAHDSFLYGQPYGWFRSLMSQTAAARSSSDRPDGAASPSFPEADPEAAAVGEPGPGPGWVASFRWYPRNRPVRPADPPGCPPGPFDPAECGFWTGADLLIFALANGLDGPLRALILAGGPHMLLVPPSAFSARCLEHPLHAALLARPRAAGGSAAGADRLVLFCMSQLNLLTGSGRLEDFLRQLGCHPVDLTPAAAVAAAAGTTQRLTMLLTQPGPRRGRTPLMEACAGGRLAAAGLLLKAAIDPNQPALGPQDGGVGGPASLADLADPSALGDGAEWLPGDPREATFDLTALLGSGAPPACWGHFGLAFAGEQGFTPLHYLTLTPTPPAPPGGEIAQTLRPVALLGELLRGGAALDPLLGAAPGTGLPNALVLGLAMGSLPLGLALFRRSDLGECAAPAAAEGAPATWRPQPVGGAPGAERSSGSTRAAREWAGLLPMVPPTIRDAVLFDLLHPAALAHALQLRTAHPDGGRLSWWDQILVARGKRAWVECAESVLGPGTGPGCEEAPDSVAAQLPAMAQRGLSELGLPPYTRLFFDFQSRRRFERLVAEAVGPAFEGALDLLLWGRAPFAPQRPYPRPGAWGGPLRPDAAIVQDLARAARARLQRRRATTVAEALLPEQPPRGSAVGPAPEEPPRVPVIRVLISQPAVRPAAARWSLPSPVSPFRVRPLTAVHLPSAAPFSGAPNQVAALDEQARSVFTETVGTSLVLGRHLAAMERLLDEFGRPFALWVLAYLGAIESPPESPPEQTTRPLPIVQVRPLSPLASSLLGPAGRPAEGPLYPSVLTQPWGEQAALCLVDTCVLEPDPAPSPARTQLAPYQTDAAFSVPPLLARRWRVESKDLSAELRELFISHVLVAQQLRWRGGLPDILQAASEAINQRRAGAGLGPLTILVDAAALPDGSLADPEEALPWQTLALLLEYWLPRWSTALREPGLTITLRRSVWHRTRGFGAAATTPTGGRGPEQPAVGFLEAPRLTAGNPRALELLFDYGGSLAAFAQTFHYHHRRGPPGEGPLWCCQEARRLTHWEGSGVGAGEAAVVGHVVSGWALIARRAELWDQVEAHLAALRASLRHEVGRSGPARCPEAHRLGPMDLDVALDALQASGLAPPAGLPHGDLRSALVGLRYLLDLGLVATLAASLRAAIYRLAALNRWSARLQFTRLTLRFDGSPAGAPVSPRTCSKLFACTFIPPPAGASPPVGNPGPAPFRISVEPLDWWLLTDPRSGPIALRLTFHAPFGAPSFVALPTYAEPIGAVLGAFGEEPDVRLVINPFASSHSRAEARWTQPQAQPSQPRLSLTGTPGDQPAIFLFLVRLMFRFGTIAWVVCLLFSIIPIEATWDGVPYYTSPTPPPKVGGHTFTALGKTFFMVGGLKPDGVPNPYVYRYANDPGLGWRIYANSTVPFPSPSLSPPPLAPGVWGHSAIVDNATMRLLVYGGRYLCGQNPAKYCESNELWALHYGSAFSNDSAAFWEQLPSPDDCGSARGFHACARIGRQMIVIGGASTTPGNIYAHPAAAFDLDVNAWAPVAIPPGLTVRQGAVSVPLHSPLAPPAAPIQLGPQRASLSAPPLPATLGAAETLNGLYVGMGAMGAEADRLPLAQLPLADGWLVYPSWRLAELARTELPPEAAARVREWAPTDLQPINATAAVLEVRGQDEAGAPVWANATYLRTYTALQTNGEGPAWPPVEMPASLWAAAAPIQDGSGALLFGGLVMTDLETPSLGATLYHLNASSMAITRVAATRSSDFLVLYAPPRGLYMLGLATRATTYASMDVTEAVFFGGLSAAPSALTLASHDPASAKSLYYAYQTCCPIGCGLGQCDMGWCTCPAGFTGAQCEASTLGRTMLSWLGWASVPLAAGFALFFLVPARFRVTLSSVIIFAGGCCELAGALTSPAYLAPAALMSSLVGALVALFGLSKNLRALRLLAYGGLPLVAALNLLALLGSILQCTGTTACAAAVARGSTSMLVMGPTVAGAMMLCALLETFFVLRLIRPPGQHTLLQALREANDELLAEEAPVPEPALPPPGAPFAARQGYLREWMRYRRAQEPQRDVPITIHRAALFDDSYAALSRLTPEKLARRLVVTFEGEEGLDLGGLAREWYTAVGRALVNPDYALFTRAEESAYAYLIAPISAVHDDVEAYFRFVGRFLGKAIADRQTIDVHFSRSFYKCLLGRPAAVQDLEAADPEFFRSLTWLLEHPVDPSLELDVYFTATTDELGEQRVVELKPGGRAISVTDQNKQEYVALVADFRLRRSIRAQAEAVRRGFLEVVPDELCALFSEAELELLLSGIPEIDPDDWVANTAYEGYRPDDRTVMAFWEVIRGSSLEERALILQFVTGTARLPYDGFAGLQGRSGPALFTIRRVAVPTDHLPCSHTCFNQLDLPPYDSAALCRQRLMTAVSMGGVGFGAR
ncbi:putative E3 ubiquitin-protein ligase TOM1 [Paratrimastix pyriformis]|uniref:E3 ubiquitin-protein ligase HACE1 n=1 Tax=Paratrimastix pyriformis TaxID=342808 RepID=A0ABQ8UX17_9EUKA|nr:putative E3 ubiquitin-protein ligase TOM1 [Paratrimastix pyriformis]